MFSLLFPKQLIEFFEFYSSMNKLCDLTRKSKLTLRNKVRSNNFPWRLVIRLHRLDNNKKDYKVQMQPSKPVLLDRQIKIKFEAIVLTFVIRFT